MRYLINRIWYKKHLNAISVMLLPFSWLFAAIVRLRRYCYRKGYCRVYQSQLPVIVVGNISIGGTGKTPLVIWLAQLLLQKGYKPGIVSRGVGGKKHEQPHFVTKGDLASTVGDEALLIHRNSGCPFVICAQRYKAIAKLSAETECNIIISDDGLQHYAMAREIEIAVVDGMLRLGNKQYLPAGPLREGPWRLTEVDFVVVNGGNINDKYSMSLVQQQLVRICDGKQVPLLTFAPKKIHAVAAIGNPERFFLSLLNAGFALERHEFPDHYLYKRTDLQFADDQPIIMTEKDAMKCAEFADERYWYLPVSVRINPAFESAFMTLLEARHETAQTRTNSIAQL